MEARRDLQPWLWCFFYPCVSFNNAAKLRGTDASNPTITWLKTQFLCTLSRYRLPAALSFSCRFLKGKQVWNGKVCFIVYNESYLRCLAVTGQTIKNHIQSQESMTWLMTDRGVGRWDKTVSGVWTDVVWVTDATALRPHTVYSAGHTHKHKHKHSLKIGYSHVAHQLTHEVLTFDPEVTNPNISPPLTERLNFALLAASV